MFRRLITIAGALGLAVSPMLADFSYQEKSTVTGGAVAGIMKVAGVFSKAAREPIETTVAVKGDRMANRSDRHASIIDLGAQTITQIDLKKKTYSVMTFEQMKAMLEQMQQRMKQNPNAGQMSFKVSANKTSNRKTIDGMAATELILKMEMQGTDQQTGEQGGMAITTDLWVAPAASGYAEVRGFHRRLAEKLNWAPGGNMFMSNPQVSEGMAEVAKEMSKLDGMPVFETLSMGTDASAGSLLEMTVEMSGFSSSPVDPTLFEVPAGFKKVEPDTRRRQ
jgi:hypothetical protein